MKHNRATRRLRVDKEKRLTARLLQTINNSESTNHESDTLSYA